MLRLTSTRYRRIHLFVACSELPLMLPQSNFSPDGGGGGGALRRQLQATIKDDYLVDECYRVISEWGPEHQCLIAIGR